MSILSEVAICNLALDACGARATITSLQENSKEAKACARQYAPALAATLQHYYERSLLRMAERLFREARADTPAFPDIVA